MPGQAARDGWPRGHCLLRIRGAADLRNPDPRTGSEPAPLAPRALRHREALRPAQRPARNWLPPSPSRRMEACGCNLLRGQPQAKAPGLCRHRPVGWPTAVLAIERLAALSPVPAGRSQPRSAAAPRMRLVERIMHGPSNSSDPPTAERPGARDRAARAAAGRDLPWIPRASRPGRRPRPKLAMDEMAVRLTKEEGRAGRRSAPPRHTPAPRHARHGDMAPVVWQASDLPGEEAVLRRVGGPTGGAAPQRTSASATVSPAFWKCRAALVQGIWHDAFFLQRCRRRSGNAVLVPPRPTREDDIRMGCRRVRNAVHETCNWSV